MPFKWDEELENKVLHLREQGKTFPEIANTIGTTTPSVKHKYLRLRKRDNSDEHHHPKEKTAQVHKVLQGKSNLSILETNAGWGNLTRVYTHYGQVLAHDIESRKIEHIMATNQANNLELVCGDSFTLTHLYVGQRRKFDVIDLDPYGMPSRYFPHILLLIQNGVLLLTFPRIGIQQINKITKEHYRVFWGLTLEDKDTLVDKVYSKIQDFGMQNYRHVELIDTLLVDRVYRLAFKVQKRSALDMVDLTVRRNTNV